MEQPSNAIAADPKSVIGNQSKDNTDLNRAEANAQKNLDQPGGNKVITDEQVDALEFQGNQ